MKNLYLILFFKLILVHYNAYSQCGLIVTKYDSLIISKKYNLDSSYYFSDTNNYYSNEGYYYLARRSFYYSNGELYKKGLYFVDTSEIFSLYGHYIGYICIYDSVPVDSFPLLEIVSFNYKNKKERHWIANKCDRSIGIDSIWDGDRLISVKPAYLNSKKGEYKAGVHKYFYPNQPSIIIDYDNNSCIAYRDTVEQVLDFKSYLTNNSNIIYDSVLKEVNVYTNGLLRKKDCFGNFLIRDSSLYKMIDSTGKIITSYAYHSIAYTPNKNFPYYLVRKDNLFGLISAENGKEIFSPIYKSLFLDKEIEFIIVDDDTIIDIKTKERIKYIKHSSKFRGSYRLFWSKEFGIFDCPNTRLFRIEYSALDTISKLFRSIEFGIAYPIYIVTFPLIYLLFNAAHFMVPYAGGEFSTASDVWDETKPRFRKVKYVKIIYFFDLKGNLISKYRMYSNTPYYN